MSTTDQFAKVRGGKFSFKGGGDLGVQGRGDNIENQHWTEQALDCRVVEHPPSPNYLSASACFTP